MGFHLTRFGSFVAYQCTCDALARRFSHAVFGLSRDTFLPFSCRAATIPWAAKGMKTDPTEVSQLTVFLPAYSSFPPPLRRVV